MAKGWTASATNAKTEKAGPGASTPGPAPLPQEFSEPADFRGLGNVWYAARSGRYYRETKDGKWIEYREGDFRRYLNYCGFPIERPKGGFISALDSMMVEVHHHRRLDYAGELAGYRPGMYTVCGNRILVTRGPRVIKPVRGPWPKLKTLIQQLLGDQGRYFYGWLKAAHQSLSAGFPWRPGQMLVIAGPAGCGKSLLQNLITEMLGGRACKPYAYLSGETDFNASLFAAEHWAIEDEASGTDIRVRRHFGSMVKNALVNQVQRFHAKGIESMSMTPYLRMTMSVNDNPESLMVLPPIDEDVRDKIILLRATPVRIPGDGADPESRRKFWDALMKELPAFLFAMNQWRIPKDMVDQRYGIGAWQHPDLVVDVDQLAPEFRLLNLIDSLGLWNKEGAPFSGSAFEVEKLLRNKDRQGELSRLCSFNAACGIYLKRLSSKVPDRVQIEARKGNQNVYVIFKPH
jgi:hypothetical protein